MTAALAHDELLQLAADLDAGSNLFGPLPPEVRARLFAAVENPGPDTWGDAHSIILNRRTWLTVWQSVVAVDPSFPRHGPVSELGGPPGRWDRWPSRDTLLAAICYGVSGGESP